MKVVLDTNVWISSLLVPNSIPGKIISAWQQAIFEVITSHPILEEIKDVLYYPKIKKRLSVSNEDISDYLAFIRFFTTIVEIDHAIIDSITEIRDVKDRPILATLIVSHADYLVTGDQDLLTLHQKYPIITPQKFAEFLD
jgi:putative PIN family toxin of toxin-antitoxin system